MTDRAKSIVAIYLATIACCLAVVSMVEDEYRSRAFRLDLKVMTLELKGQSSIIDRMGVLRNHTRAKAAKMQTAVLLLAIAFAVASPALIANVAGAWFLILTSWVASGSAAYFVWGAVT